MKYRLFNVLELALVQPQSDHNDADQRCDGKHVGREDTRDAAGFAHDGGRVSDWI